MQEPRNGQCGYGDGTWLLHIGPLSDRSNRSHRHGHQSGKDYNE